MHGEQLNHSAYQLYLPVGSHSPPERQPRDVYTFAFCILRSWHAQTAWDAPHPSCDSRSSAAELALLLLA